MQQMTLTKPGFVIYFIAWMDNKPVHLLSSLKSTITQCERYVETKGKGKGGWESQTMPQPSIINIYNRFIGGTDKNDQYISYIRPNLKSMSWVVRVYVHLIIISVVNAFIIYSALQDKKGYSVRDFTSELCAELAMETLDDSEPNSTSQSTTRKSSSYWNSSQGMFHQMNGAMVHTPRIIEFGHKKRSTITIKIVVIYAVEVVQPRGQIVDFAFNRL